MTAASVEPVTPFGREGVEHISIRRRPLRESIGRQPFPISDLRAEAGTGKAENRLQADVEWLSTLYATDLPLRDFSLLSADDVVVMRGSVWHRGVPLEGTLPPKQARKPDTLVKWAGKVCRAGKKAARPGRTAIIHAAGYRNYFHWTVEILPRLFALREAMRQGSVQVDRILFFYEEPRRFVAESINALLPEFEPLIDNTTEQATRLEHCLFFVDSTPDAEYQDHRSHTSRLKVCTALLAEDVQAKLGAFGKIGGRAILVSRDDAPKRRLINESLLLEWFADRCLERVLLSELSVSEQIALMREASLVVGVHGAGLTNVLYCRPGTAVVEINSADYLRRCRSFADLAMYGRLHYGVAVADADEGGSAEGSEDPDIQLPVDAESRLRDLVDRLCATAPAT